MNKKQIIEITKDSVLFNIQTNLIKMDDLNQSRLTFVTENLLKIVKDSRTDIYLNVKDIKIVEVKK